MNRSAQAIESNPKLIAQGSDDAHDRALLRRFVHERDSDALGELLARHAHAAYRLARHFSSNGHDAEDSVQVAAVNVLNHAVQFDEKREGSVRLWIMGIVVNVCRKKRLENSRRAAREVRAAAIRPATVSAEHVFNSEQDQLHRDVAKAVHALPALYRAPLSLHYYEGLSSPEVAAVLQIPENTIRSQIKRGIERLREMLTTSGISLSVVDLGVLIGTLQLEQAPASLLSSLHSIAHQKPIPARRPRAKKPQTQDGNWKIAGAIAAAVILILCLLAWGTYGGGSRTPKLAQAPNTASTVADNSKAAQKDIPHSEQILQNGKAMPDEASAGTQAHQAPVADPGLHDPLTQDPTQNTEENDPMKSKLKHAMLSTALAIATANAGARAAEDPKPNLPVANTAVPQIFDPGTTELMGFAAIPDVTSAIDHLDVLVRAFNSQIPAGMMKMQVGMMLNDPALANLDATHPIVAMLFKIPASNPTAKPPFAFFVPAKDAGPYAALAERAQMVSAFSDGVIIIAPTPEALKLAQAQTALYTKIAATKVGADTRVYLNNANLISAYGKQMMDMAASIGNQAAAVKASGMNGADVSKLLNLELKVFLELASEVDAEQFDVTLTGDAITVETVAKAKKDTAMSELFATAPVGENPMLKFLSTAGLEAWTARIDPIHERAFMKKVLDAASKDADFAEYVTPAVKTFATSWTNVNSGDFATSINILPGTGANIELALSITDDKAIAPLYDQFQALNGPDGPFGKYYATIGAKTTSSIQKAARTYRGVDILHYKLNADLTKVDPSVAASLKVMMKDMDIAATQHTYVAANLPAEVDKMVDKIVDGTAKPTVTLEAMNVFGPGKQAYLDYNFIELLKAILAEMPNNPLASTLKQLSDSKPIVASAICDDGRALIQLRVPLGPLVELTDSMKAQMQHAAPPPATTPPAPAPAPDEKNEKF